jgi:hypothetical protein
LISNIPLIIFQASKYYFKLPSEISLIGAYVPVSINSCKLLILFALKGTVPDSIAYKTTPADHISTPYPS